MSDTTINQVPLAAPIPDDFGDRLGPVVVKELRQGLRARRFVGPFLLIHLVAVFAVMTEAATGAVGASIVGTGLLVSILGLMLCVAMPLSGFGALQPELHPGRNIELLLLANLSRWQIVIGKWLVMTSLAGLILVSLLPYLLIRHYIGGSVASSFHGAIARTRGRGSATCHLPRPSRSKFVPCCTNVPERCGELRP